MKLDHYTFLSGAELADGSLIIAAQDTNLDIQKTPHTLILQRFADGEWQRRSYTKWLSAGVSYTAARTGVTLLSNWGRCVELESKSSIKTDIINVKDNDQKVVFRFSKSVAGDLYAGGTHRYLFQKEGEGWSELSTDEMKASPLPKSFENITGFGRDKLYAFGWMGVIWSNEGGAWHQIESPTQLFLNDGDVHGDKVIIGGQAGTILRGRGEVWEVIENDVLSQDIWSVCSFGESVYFSMMSGILCLTDNDLSLVKPLGPDMRTAMSLFTGPSGLWSIGSSDIALFDGKDWQSVISS